MNRAPESRFFFATDLSTLARKLTDQIAKDKKRDPLQPRRIIVPNRNVARWLEMRLADWSGVCGNVDFQFLEPGIGNRIEEITGKKRALASREDLTLGILECFFEGQVSGALARYIESRNSTDLYHLAAKLASLFQDYEYHRAEWADRWLKGDFAAPAGAHDQAELYFNVMRRMNARGLSNLRGFASFIQEGSAQSEPLILFGVSQISKLHVDILFQLSQLLPLEYYMLDFLQPQKQKWYPCNGLFDEPVGPVRSWLSVQSQQIKILLDQKKENHVWQASLSVPEEASILSTLQRVFTGAPIKKGKEAHSANAGRSPDSSVVIVGCPGVVREAETILFDIVDRMKEDPTLQLTDIAILVPDMKKYRPALEAVFERDVDAQGRPGIPFSITDFRSGDASLYAAGAHALLDLMDGEFRRSQVFALLRNPCFQHARGISEKTVADWSDYIDRLAVYHGMDPEDPYSFMQGLRRLRLGYVMNLEEGDFAGIVPFHDIFIDEREAGLLSRTIHDLALEIEALRAKAAFEMPEALRKFLEAHLAVPPSRKHERRVQSSVMGMLVRLSHTKVQLPVEIMREIILASASGLSANRGDYLSEGVTISSLQPMRPIPFRITYIAGMEEGSFPGRADESAINLRNAHPAAGDVSLPEANRMLFLESFLAARDRVFITYNARDTQKDAHFAPCSVVQELIEAAAAIGIQLVPRMVPIHAAVVREGFIPEPESVTALLESVSAGKSAAPDQIEIVKEYLSSRNVSVKHRKNASRRIVSVTRLKAYLEDPVASVLRDAAGMREELEVDSTLDDVEPFYMRSFQYPMMWREAIQAYFQANGQIPVNQIVENLYGNLERRLRVPAGAFGKVQKMQILARLDPSKWQSLTEKKFAPASLSDVSATSGDVSIVGEIPFLRETPGLIEILAPASNSRARTLLPSYVFFLAWLSARRIDASLTVHVVTVSDGKNPASKSYPFAPLQAQQAQKILDAIVFGYLSGDVEFVPFSLVERAEPQKRNEGLDPEGYAALLTAILDDPDQGPFTYSRLAALSEARITTRAYDLVRDRLGYLLDGVL
ncbi:MAG TPA: exodeoxyribonuclease V subunit gamma [Leptospiraceae bacterium]|nr:exodeoxyribonuclease V subunit gamma [Leptospiraceae bacterium]